MKKMKRRTIELKGHCQAHRLVGFISFPISCHYFILFYFFFMIISVGMIGWPQMKYKNLERMTYYISPKYTMVGPKVQEHPYSSIFIG